MLSLPLTCGDISHQIRLKSGKYGGYAVISMSNSMEILLKSNGGRMGLGTAGFPHVSLFFHTSSSLASLHSSSVFLFLSASPSFLACAVFSFCFLPARCLAKPFFSLPDSASFLLLFSSLCSFPSFSLLVSQLQMSNPSTPPQAVSGIVYKCGVVHV